MGYVPHNMRSLVVNKPVKDTRFALFPRRRFHDGKRVNGYIWLRHYVITYRWLLYGIDIIHVHTIEEDFQEMMES